MASIYWVWWCLSGMEPLNFFTSAPLDCKKTSFLNIKAHLILDKIGYFCMTSYTNKKMGVGAAPLLQHAWLIWLVYHEVPNASCGLIGLHNYFLWACILGACMKGAHIQNDLWVFK